jgi:hypothetical protein
MTSLNAKVRIEWKLINIRIKVFFYPIIN